MKDIRRLTCIECPIGCSVEVELEDGAVTLVRGNNCPRGKIYAQSEVVCPMRVVTSTVRLSNGQMLPVKTDRPVKKENVFEVMKKINSIVVDLPVKAGDVLYSDIADGASLIATDGRG